MRTVAADSRLWARDEARAATFDRVLVDAPCAGLGVLAKRADLRWRRSLSDLVELTELQVRWRQALHHTRPQGGVYTAGRETHLGGFHLVRATAERAVSKLPPPNSLC